MLLSGILYDSVEATFDMLYCSIWPNAAVFGIFCDFRHVTTSSLGIHSRFSHFMQMPFSCLPGNYSLVHNPRNLPKNCEFKFAWNKSRPFSEHVISKHSTVRWEFGYWTVCNNFKRYCTLPYCGQPHRISTRIMMKGLLYWFVPFAQNTVLANAKVHLN